MDNPRRIGVAAATTLAVFIGVAQVTADRQWLTGTWVEVGIERTPFVGDAANEQFPPGPLKPPMTEVATYVVETADRRYELQSMVAFGSDRFDHLVTVGQPVTFAIQKKTAYIKLDQGERRLLVTKNERK